MLWITVIAIFFLIFFLINRSVDSQRPWHKGFDNLNFSSDEFYKSCEDAIKKREIPGISFSRVEYFEDGTMRTKREYLHVNRGEYHYDICAAPFGSGFFISSWYAEKPDLIRKLLGSITILKSFIESRTYYQIDTDYMFKSFVHTGMLEAIDELTTSKGVRALTEFERRMPDIKK
jgi:hypothetical protein